MPELEDPDGRKQANEPMKKVDEKTGKVKEACNHTTEGGRMSSTRKERLS